MAEWVTTPISQLVPRLRQKLNLSTRGEATSSDQFNRAGDLKSADPSPEQSKVKEVLSGISKLGRRLRQKLNLSTRVEATSSNQSNRAADLTPEQTDYKLPRRLQKKHKPAQFPWTRGEATSSDQSNRAGDLTSAHPSPEQSEVKEVLSGMVEWTTTLISKLGRRLRKELNRAGDLTSAHPSLKQLEVIDVLESLKTTWRYAQSAIHDGDNTQIQSEVDMRWLADLRQMSFEAEDILDDYEYELHRQLQLEAECHFFEKTVDYIKLHRQLPDEYTSELVLRSVYENDETRYDEYPLTFEAFLDRTTRKFAERFDETGYDEYPFTDEYPITPVATAQTIRAWRITEKLNEMCERKEHHFIKKPLDYIRRHRQRRTTLSTDDYILALVLSRLDENVEVRAPTTTPLTSKAFLDQTKNRATKITEKLDEMCKRKEQLHLKASEKTRPSGATRRPTGVIPSARYIYGRDADKDLVVKMIVEESEDPVSVIALVGAGGVGKTTLAQMVYKQVKGGFDAKAWICVSDDFDAMKITRGVIESVTGLNCELKEFSALQEKLSALLEGKRLLLVLDDVWNEDPMLWDSLSFIEQIGLLQGSKILVTTRSERVALIMQPRREYHYHLKPLTDEHSWDLFQKVVFVQQEPADKQMELIAEKIAYKCRGSPLMITAIGKLLLHENSRDRWEEIMESELWDISDARGVNPVMRTLELSYIYLPAHLKQCFLYCSVYPKDYEFCKDELVWLWMAQNLVRNEGGERPEDRGQKCLKGLLERSLILRQESKEYGETFVLHDLMHDLAQYILKREQSLLSNSGGSISITSHGRYEPRVGGTWIINHQKGEHDVYNVPVERIKVLDLSVTVTSVYHQVSNKYLSFVGKMKRLRYLRIHGNIRQLPDSVRKLYYLNTVVVHLPPPTLPEGICKLQNLRHLSFPGFFNIDFDFINEDEFGGIYFPVGFGFGRLTNLQHLSQFNVRRVGGHCTIAELKGLRSLKGELQIRGLRNVETGKEAKAAELDKLVGIKTLDLMFDYVSYSSRDFQVQQKEVLENLRPHANLVGLKIFKCLGTAFPRWLGDPSFTKLVKVTLSNGDCEELPGLGQLPCLKFLSVSYLKRVQHVGVEFFGCCPSSEAFPLLEELTFTGLGNWEEWYVPEECKFPRLKYLKIRYCNRLKLPRVIEKPPTTVSELDVQGTSKIETWCREHATTSLAGIVLKYRVFTRA